GGVLMGMKVARELMAKSTAIVNPERHLCPLHDPAVSRMASSKVTVMQETGVTPPNPSRTLCLEQRFAFQIDSESKIMNVETIREFCLAFPHAKENLQWGDDLCFKVRGKIFAIVSLDDPRLCFKCTPGTFSDLIEREDIHPAPYVGRYMRVMLNRLDAVGWSELKHLILQSYEMVAAKVPRRPARRNSFVKRRVGRALLSANSTQESKPRI